MAFLFLMSGHPHHVALGIPAFGLTMLGTPVILPVLVHLVACNHI